MVSFRSIVIGSDEESRPCGRERDRNCLAGLRLKGVDDFHGGLFEVRAIAGRDRQAMNEPWLGCARRRTKR